MTFQAYYLIEIHEKYQNHPERRRALEQCVDRSIIMFKLLAFIFASAVFFNRFIPLHVFLYI